MISIIPHPTLAKREAFEAWYYEIENFSLRAERMAISYADAQAAFDAGWSAALAGKE